MSSPNRAAAREAWRQGRKARLVATLVVLCVGAAASAVAFHRPLFEGNFGVVEPARVYRCAQPIHNLTSILDRCQPASILNLRGGSNADAWYSAEVQASRARGIDFYDVPMSPVRRPTRRELLTIIDLLKRCRYPLLVHCKSGADRTGLVVALYLMTERGEPPARAERAFSLDYGHVPLGGPEHLHEPLEEYAAWLKQHGVRHTPERFVGWVALVYRAPDPLVALPPVQPGPRLQAESAAADRAVR